MPSPPPNRVILDWIVAITDRLIPEPLRVEDKRNTLRMVVTGQVLVFTVHVLLATPTQLGLLPGGMSAGQVVVIGISLILPSVALWLTHSRELTEVLTVTIGWSLAIAVSMLNGGIVSPQVGYLMLLPVLSIAIFDERWLRITLFMVLLGLTASYLYSEWLAALGLLPPPVPTRNYVTAMALTIFFTSLYLLALNQLKDALSSLRVETVEARTARAEAEAADQARRHFVAVTSHELRTPLTGVLGSLELLERTLQTEEQRAHLEVANHSATTLRTLIEDILVVSQLQAGKVSIRPDVFRLDLLLKRLEKQFASHAERGRNQLVFELDTDCRSWFGDATRLSQILANLTSNSLKFTADGTVTVSVTQVPEGLLATVSDTGVGMAPEMVDRLFEPFVQGHTASFTGEPGTGLGLGITRNLVELIGGELHIETELGKGTTISATIPFTPSETAHPTPVPLRPARERNQQFRLLVVDDNPVNTLVLQKMLLTLGAQADCASGGVSAVERATTTRYDAVLMDVHMPDLDGLSATRRIRDQGFEGPIIGLTASPTSEQVDAATDAGMDKVLGKPTSLEELDDLLGSLDAAD